jgi:NO-binding membrane sensor protein with MHYT domain
MVLTATYNPYLVGLSILVATYASCTALGLGGRLAAARGLARRMLVAVAAITMGGGIGATALCRHAPFIISIPMSYDVGPTTLSLLVAIFATGVGFYVMSGDSASPLRLIASSILDNTSACLRWLAAKSHGLGVGSAISPSIVESYGGRLRATDDARHGRL